jgi:hypothetical protein
MTKKEQEFQKVRATYLRLGKQYSKLNERSSKMDKLIPKLIKIEEKYHKMGQKKTNICLKTESKKKQISTPKEKETTIWEL